MAAHYLTFFVIVAGVAATLFGLALVTFQLDTDRWRGDPLKSATAMSTLLEFGAPFLVAMLAVTPGTPWRWGAGPAGVAGLAGVWWFVSRYRRAPVHDRFDRMQLLLCVVPVATYGLLLLSTALSSAAGLRLASAMLVWLLLSGSVEAWMFSTRSPDDH